MTQPPATAEHQRLTQDKSRTHNWKRWGPYLSERQWGTVREDYSAGGDSWRDFTHEQSRARAYRWGEDGLLGWTDRQCRLCLSVALWNGNDAILKERLFGLTGPEGNHGEDVKEIYHYTDSTPTHSYATANYWYPQAAFPYDDLVQTNADRGYNDPEYEIVDTGVFDGNRFFEIQATYAKAGPDDICLLLSITNHGDAAADLTVLPQAWYRNTWVWGCNHEGCDVKPMLHRGDQPHSVRIDHETLPPMHLAFEPSESLGYEDLIFTDNETNFKSLFGTPNLSSFTKDAFHRYVIDGQSDAVRPRHGTKVAGVYRLSVEAGQTQSIRVRMAPGPQAPELGETFDQIIRDRRREADEFYDAVLPDAADRQQRHVSRQAYAGLMWSKQFYHYIVRDWLTGDRDVATPPGERWHGRNADWQHLFARDVLSMPDKWEYPWFAAWDLAFHVVPIADIDPEFAKRQMMVLLREWYTHPRGQLPAYEFDFGDVNPPVHAWGCLRVFQAEAAHGEADYAFLSGAFQRLLMNFTWWVNRVDGNGDNIFAGGFLGLDNIGVFDRSKGGPDGSRLEQADGTAWMAFFCGTMLSMSLELALHDETYADMASKFLDHYVRIVEAVNGGPLGSDGSGLWDEQDGIYYDHLVCGDTITPLKVRSLVGLLPMIAVTTIDGRTVERLPGFADKLRWFLANRPVLSQHVTHRRTPRGDRWMLSIPTSQQLPRLLSLVLDEAEFLSPHGIRSMSRYHLDNPLRVEIGGEQHVVAYLAGESDSGMFGGNSNWRGPVWMPINYLLIEGISRYGEFYGDSMLVRLPGRDSPVTLTEVAEELNRRLTTLFLDVDEGGRPCLRSAGGGRDDDLWQRDVLFHEYFNGDTGDGLGASHQTGWTAIVASCIRRLVGGEGVWEADQAVG